MNTDVKREKRLAWLYDLITQRRERRGVYIQRVVRSLWRGDSHLPPPMLEPLSPVDVEDDRIATYESEILKALKTPEVRNIAITGGYGAGKSSLIRSFVSRHPEYRCAFISLASFEQSEIAEGAAPSEDAIESTIVQQLLYSVPAHDVPGTRLKRISHLRARAVWARASLVALVAIFYLRLTDEWPKLLPDLSASIEWIPSLVAQIGFASAITVVIYGAIRALSSLRIRELSFQGVKLDGGTESSALHKHVDEIIHLFEMVPTDLVIVEDLDRFNDKSPFVRLREINFIVNSSAAIRHPVRFIYALNDELFEADEKAKFFDLIIPLIPVINSDNSRDMFISMLENRVGMNISKDERVARLVETIAYYVGDMRQLKQMVNEFELYRALLRGLHVGDACKELAMVAIRCVYPRQYSALLKGQGGIREVFDMYPAWLHQEIKVVEDRLKALQIDADEASKDAAVDVTEIKRIIWSRMEDAANGGVVTEIYLNGYGQVSKAQFISDQDIHEKLGDASSVRLLRSGSFVGNANVAALVADGSPSLQMRLDRKVRLVEPDEIEVARLEKRLDELHGMSLGEATVDSAFMQSVSSYCERNDMQLIPYLMKNGFLGADYPDYIGYFYPGSMSLADKSSLLDLRFGKILDVDHAFDSPSLVLSKLSLSELSGGVGMISALLENLLDESGGERQLRLKRFQSIFSDADANLARVDELARSMSARGKFTSLMEMVAKVSPEFSLKLSERGRYSSEPSARLSIVVAVARVVLPVQGQALTGNVCASLSSIEDLEGMVAACEGSHISSWFEMEDARMIMIGGEPSRETVHRAIRRRIIRINQHNIVVVTRAILGNWAVSASYSTVRQSDSPELESFVHANWEQYIRSVYSGEHRMTEDGSTFIAMLGRSRSIEGLTEFLMQAVESKIERLDLLEPILWKAATEHGHVQITVRNLIEVATSNEISSEDRSLIGSHLVEHLNGKGEKSDIEDVSQARIDALCHLAFILPEKVQVKAAALIISLGQQLKALRSDLVSEGFAMSMVMSRLPFSDEVFDATLSVSLKAAVALAVDNVERFVDYAKINEPSVDVLLGVLSSSLVGTAEKLRVVNVVSEGEVQESRELALLCANLLGGVVSGKEMERVYERDKIVAIFKAIETESDLIVLLASVMLCAPWHDMAHVFARLIDSNFAELLSRPKRVEVASTAENIRLLNTLQLRGIIGIPKNKSDLVWARVRTSKLV